MSLARVGRFAAAAAAAAMHALVKPAFHVPSVATILTLPWNGYRVVSTFAGGGGSSTGYRLAGFRVVWANEFVEKARACYAANWPDTPIDGRDIRRVRGADIGESLGLAPGDLDLLDGSPPCASYSTMGAREKLWGKTKKYSDTAQRTDDLIPEYLRLVGELRPKVCVMENVKGLVAGVARGDFTHAMTQLDRLGYRASARVVDASWLGVPQERQRVIIMGVRADLDVLPAFPTPLPYQYSIRDALPDVVSVRLDRTTASIGAGAKCVLTVNVDRPCKTFTTRGIGADDKVDYRITHASAPGLEAKGFTIDEAKRLCGFPDDYVITGDSYSARWERLGRAVPPLMMGAIATTARAVLDRIHAPRA